MEKLSIFSRTYEQIKLVKENLSRKTCSSVWGLKNCLYFPSEVENEKSKIVNPCILLRIILPSFYPIEQVMTEPWAF